MSTLHPSTCGESVKFGKSYLCKLACTPCRLYFGEQCEKLKMEKFQEAITKLINNEVNKNKEEVTT